MYLHLYYQNNLPVGLKVKGHAESGPYGHDLVCAAVNEAIKTVERVSSEEMAKITGQMNLPGMF